MFRKSPNFISRVNRKRIVPLNSIAQGKKKHCNTCRKSRVVMSHYGSWANLTLYFFSKFLIFAWTKRPMINFQDRTFKYGNRKETVLLMPGVLWEFYYRFICPPVANFTSCSASVFYGLVTPCPYFSKSKIHKGVIIIVLFSCLVSFLFFNFIGPKHSWHFLSFLNIYRRPPADLTRTRDTIPVSHLLRIKDR